MHRPHAFKAVYAVTLHGELLRTDLRIINTGDKPFEFTAALHTYIEVLDINKATVKGLKDLDYLDKVCCPLAQVLALLSLMAQCCGAHKRRDVCCQKQLVMFVLCPYRDGHGCAVLSAIVMHGLMLKRLL